MECSGFLIHLNRIYINVWCFVNYLIMIQHNYRKLIMTNYKIFYSIIFQIQMFESCELGLGEIFA